MDEFFCNNTILEIESFHNRDDCFYPYYMLRTKFCDDNCDLSTFDINSPIFSDIVIYNDMPDKLPRKEDKQKSYLLLFESEVIKSENWNLEKHQYFNKIFTWNDDFVDNKKYFKINFSHLFPKTIDKELSKKNKFCTLIAGNKSVRHPLELYSKRVETIRWFEKNHLKDFEFYGVGWDSYRLSNKYLNYIFKKTRLSRLIKPIFPSYRGKVVTKKAVLQNYQFAICYENARDIPGYITEKIFDCFFAGCVPIYWGANNISVHIPKECFIDKRDFSSYEALYNFMIKMSEDDYLKYLYAIEKFLNSDDGKPFTAEYFAEKIVSITLNDLKQR